ncbi:MAG TPA: hypothetical protein VKI19_12880, partial [Acidimicrobiales bacterium]|nr:hypothetical protein [Acidimicrobiales bacterium]
MHQRRVPVVVATVLLGAALSACSSSSAGPRVLTVGTYHGRAGKYASVQAAVRAARPGDWILIGPGDYHETADAHGAQGSPHAGQIGGVYVTTPRIHIRGMDRNSVVIDGTKPGSPRCSANPLDQNFGPAGADGKALGRNGILVWKADDVYVDNLTVCDFLAGTGASGNQIWWNGGNDSGRLGMKGYWGSYLTATSTFFRDEATAPQYGIFANNAAGPAALDHLYASNMNDSGAYVGACEQACDVTIDHSKFEYNALGYSGTNSGGAVLIQNSEFDHNQDGLDTNTQIAGDAPAPQNGACRGGAESPITHTVSCWVFRDNSVHDNNNPDAPSSGGAAAGPVGTGMTVSGGTNDTVTGNHFYDNGAWGVLFVPYADSNPPTNGQTCTGGGGQQLPGLGCVLDPKGDALLGNTFDHNGSFGNPSNSDFGQITLFPHEAVNCYQGNAAPDGTAPANLQQLQRSCGSTTTASNTGGALLSQVLCDTHLGRCPAGARYPKPTGVVLQALPTDLASM